MSINTNYDIAENQRDLDFLDSVETNTVLDGGDLFMDDMLCLSDWAPKRSIKVEDYEIEVLELYKGDKMLAVSKHDVEAMAKHFGLLK